MIFYCQREIEGEKSCKQQCDHCKEYYSPLSGSMGIIPAIEKGGTVVDYDPNMSWEKWVKQLNEMSELYQKNNPPNLP
jgi:hypothetical protein